ncbi:MAG TPA: M20/M25/M40 family metallo-hydrolase, partial [Opitutales bacterium]|nr:M20/M25/M40 family metallo-hydrolase [Opitutales bacterium]
MDPIAELTSFVSAASVSTDPQYASGMQQARAFLTRLLGRIGFNVEEVATPCHPIILASRGENPAWPHVVIYGHYDVQPADPLELWQTPPFEPQIRDGRMFGRGTADNKGPLMTHIAAVARLLEAQPDLPLRITFMIEGEEEMGSPSFSAFIHKYRERLRGDFVLLSDTKSPSVDQLAITVGLRGLVALEAVIEGPASDLHSGLYGGAVMNPIRAMAQLLSTL